MKEKQSLMQKIELLIKQAENRAFLNGYEHGYNYAISRVKNNKSKP